MSSYNCKRGGVEEKLERISQQLDTLIRMMQRLNNLHAEPLSEEEWNGKTYQKYSVVELRGVGVPPGLRHYMANPPSATNYEVELYNGGECLLGMHGDGYRNEFKKSERSLWRHMKTEELTKECAVLIDPDWLKD